MYLGTAHSEFKDGQNIEEVNAVAVGAEWLYEDDNNDSEEPINKSEDEIENFAEEATDGANDTVENNVDGSDNFNNKEKNFHNNNQKTSKETTENMDVAAMVITTLQLEKKRSEEHENLLEEADDNIVVNILGTAIDVNSSVDFDNNSCNTVGALVERVVGVI